MNEKNPEIILDNIKSSEVISYQFLIIKGHIINRNMNCLKHNNDIVYLLLDSFKFNSNLIDDNKFKFLLSLNIGVNLIKLNYCCVSLDITIEHCPYISKYNVLPLYIICDGHDGHFQAPNNSDNNIDSALKRINIGAKLLQSIFGEKLNEQKLGRKTFSIANDCLIFNSKLNYLNARKMQQKDLWNYLANEIMNSNIYCDKKKYLGFLSCSKYSPPQSNSILLNYNDIINATEGYVALGGGGFALFGTACLFTWPENFQDILNKFLDNTKIDKKFFMDDSCYRGTFGGCFSTTLGSVLHELCHTFDLGHTKSGIMARGFDDIYKIFLNIDEDYDKSHSLSDIYQSNIEFKEKLESGRLSERLNEEKKEFSIKSLNLKRDNIEWTRHCAVFLSYHKWFNNYPNGKNYILKYDSITKFLSSTAGIRVIEIRRENDGMVLKDWIFDRKILKFSFQISEFEMENYADDKLILIVEDNFGNILKELLN